MGSRLNFPIVPIIIWLEVNFFGKTILPETVCLFLIILFILGVTMKKLILPLLFILFFCFSAMAQEINLPDTGAYGKIQGGDETHVNEVVYKIPYEIRGNYILTYEVWDADTAGEIKVYLNDQEIAIVPALGNEVWSATQTLRIKDILLCDDNLENKIKFNNESNPPETYWWGVRNVQLTKDSIMNNLTLYQEPTGKDITIAWDDTNADITGENYHFFLWNEGEQKKYLTGKTQQTQITIKLPRTGLWLFYARACKPDASDPPEQGQCSDWGHSALEQLDGTAFGQIDNPANPGTLINGKWMIYGHVAAPSGGGIE
jgi:hypothetical protein